MNIGDRIKEERERLGFDQASFAALGGASRHSQIDWEKGKSFPNAQVLAAYAAAGADVQYILTGIRSQQVENTEHSTNYAELKRKKLDKLLDDLNPDQHDTVIRQVELIQQLNQCKVELEEFKRKVG